MAKVKMPHAGHERHMCYLVNVNFHQENTKEYKALVKDAKFMCANCGLVAVSEKSLCNPVKL